ncbi:predicted protein [Histoplasma mississippiense (nom. inval.)]|uniref:predicted protein n=1 Tax=Ajellomyces capsulatus (strain NAm1 / WU24) TaxID=2059318 RepID=UPI000157D219|nr:predicted protein [Histoplasma mississippiense (nom. inval.)]EDN04593.1 predicted protein [Histoplasma mississippiense (nom. inval.)]
MAKLGRVCDGLFTDHPELRPGVAASPPSPYRPTAKIQSSLRPSRAVVVSGGFSGSRSWSTQALALALSPLRQSVLPKCDPRSSGAGPYWVASV